MLLPGPNTTFPTLGQIYLRINDKLARNFFVEHKIGEIIRFRLRLPSSTFKRLSDCWSRVASRDEMTNACAYIIKRL